MLAVTMVMTACQAQNNHQEETESNDDAINENTVEHQENNEEEESTEEQYEEFSTYTFEDYEDPFVSVDELTEVLGGQYEYDDVNKALTITMNDREFYLVYEVPVLEVNGVYLDSDEVFVMEDDEGNPYVSKAFIEEGLETEYEYEESSSTLLVHWEENVVEAWGDYGQEEVDIHSFSPEEMVDFLSFLQTPIEGASVSTVESHLPGAPRDYRNGEHEGIDWYDFASGTEITTDTPIYAMAEGVVVRVDDDFEDYPSHEVRDEDLELAAEVGFTPEYIFDRLRGQQVWVQYENGVMIRFAHLDSIPEELELGQEVDEETVIGFVGNSGTSHAMNQDDGGLHLHKDLLIYGELFWEPFTLEETSYILRELW